MSDTNQVELRYVLETTPGTTPASPVLRPLRFTGAPDLAYTPETIVSNEIVPGRQVQDLTLVGAEAGGSVEFEAVFFDHDDLITGAMYSVWTEQNKRTKLSNTLAVASGSYTFDTGTAFKANDIIFARGFTADANNGVKTLSSGSATAAAASGLSDETPPNTAEIRVIGYNGASGDFALTTSGFANLTSSAFNFTTGGQFAVGAWVFVFGFSTTDANGWYRISAVASGQLTFDAADHTPAADTGTGDSVDLFFGDFIKNGSTERSFTLEEEFADHSPVTYQYFRGMHVTEMSLEAEPKAILTGSFNFQGFSAELTETRFSGATELAGLSSTAFNTSSNVGIIRSGGVEVDGPNFVLGVTLNINNNLRFQEAIGVLGAAGVGAGEFSVTGSLNTYFGNKTLAEKVINGTETSFDMRLEDIDGSTLLIDIPRLKFSTGAPAVPGKNEDTVVELEYQALARKISSSYTLLFNRFWRTSVA